RPKLIAHSYLPRTSLVESRSFAQGIMTQSGPTCGPYEAGLITPSADRYCLINEVRSLFGYLQLLSDTEGVHILQLTSVLIVNSHGAIRVSVEMFADFSQGVSPFDYVSLAFRRRAL